MKNTTQHQVVARKPQMEPHHAHRNLFFDFGHMANVLKFRLFLDPFEIRQKATNQLFRQYSENLVHTVSPNSNV